MKRFFKLLLVLVVLVIVSIFAFGYLLFRDMPSCGEDSEAVFYARSLSQERLKKLYSDMEEYSKRDDLPFAGYEATDKSVPHPEPFSDLKVRAIRPRDGNILIEGCFDEYVYLRFKGLVFEDEEKGIWLTFPAHSNKPYEQKMEKLWPR